MFNLDSSFLARFKNNSSALYWVMLFVLLVFEVLVIKDSVSIILKTRVSQPEARTGNGVSINFANYDQAIDRIQKSKTFVPEDHFIASPFKNKEVAK